MEQPFELWVALRYLRSRRGTAFISLITWLSIGGVAVGVAALGVVFSVMTGFEETLQDKILGANAHVMVYGMGGIINIGSGRETSIRELVDKIEALQALEVHRYSLPFPLERQRF